MTMNRRVVMLDPDGTAPPGWMHVIVHAPTGIIYEQQYGGTATLLGKAEGYLVPVHQVEALATLRSVFERGLRGAGTSVTPLTPALLDQVQRAVSTIRFWQRDNDDDKPHQLILTTLAFMNSMRHGFQSGPPTVPATWSGRTPIDHVSRPVNRHPARHTEPNVTRSHGWRTARS
jgi:Family of unknown function (DUF6210)